MREILLIPLLSNGILDTREINPLASRSSLNDNATSISSSNIDSNWVACDSLIFVSFVSIVSIVSFVSFV